MSCIVFNGGQLEIMYGQVHFRTLLAMGILGKNKFVEA